MQSEIEGSLRSRAAWLPRTHAAWLPRTHAAWLPRTHAAWLFIVVSLGVALLLPAMAFAPGSLLGLVALVVFVRMATRTHASARPRMLALSLLLVLQLGFWIAFARIIRLALIVAEVETGRALELLVVAPLLVLAPAAAKLWRWLEPHGLEPSPAAKFSLGYLCLAASCTFLAASIEWSFPMGTGAVVASLMALTFAALSLGPACVGVILELSPPGQRGTGMAAFLLAYVFARALGGWAHVPSLSDDAIFARCLALGFGAVATAVLSSFMWHGLETLTSTPASTPMPMPMPIGASDHSLGAGSLGSGSVGSGSLG